MSSIRIIFKPVEGTDDLLFSRIENCNGERLKVGAWWIDEEPDGSLVNVLTVHGDDIH